MDAYEAALEKLRNDGRSLNQLEKAIGVPAETLRDIKHGIVKDPRLATVKKIARHYDEQAAGERPAGDGERLEPVDS